MNKLVLAASRPGTTSGPKNRIRAIYIALAILIGVLASQLTSVMPASANAPGTAMVNTQRMSDATLNSTQVGWYTKGSSLSLVCYKYGQAVRGFYSPYIPGGLDNIWFKASDGYFVADVDVNTGSAAPQVPQCTNAPPPPPPPATSGRSWGSTRATNAGAVGNCTWGAYEKFKAYSGTYPALSGDAKDWYASAKSKGWTTVLDGQVNSIVVFQPGVQGAFSLGHVGWVDAVERRSTGLWVHVVEMNGSPRDGGGFNKWDSRWVKDVAGMSYILAPHK